MKKILSIIIAILLVSLMTINCFATNESSEEINIKNRILREQEANEQYQSLLTNLSNNTQGNSRSTTVDYYGGAYINDSGDLVVCVTDDYDENSNSIQEYTSNENIKVKKVDFTYNEMLQEQERISNLKKDKQSNNNTLISNLLKAISMTYIDEFNNNLVVQIKNLTTQNEIEFRKYISNKEFIRLEIGYNITSTATAWKPGRSIYVSSGSLSTGYPVYFNDSSGTQYRGFVTAGHACNVGDRVYNSSGTVLGTCVKSKFSGNTDAALIKITNSNYNISNITYHANRTLSTTSFAIPASGTTIYKEGAVTGRTSGTITATSCRAEYNGVEITDLISTTALNLEGDSGGVAYTSNNLIVGNMAASGYYGSSLTEDSFACSLICKYSNVRDNLGGRIWV